MTSSRYLLVTEWIRAIVADGEVVGGGDLDAVSPEQEGRLTTEPIEAVLPDGEGSGEREEGWSGEGACSEEELWCWKKKKKRKG